MGSRARIRLFDILHFVRDLLFPLLKRSGSHMVGTASLAPRWSAPLRDYPGAAPVNKKIFIQIESRLIEFQYLGRRVFLTSSIHQLHMIH